MSSSGRLVLAIAVGVLASACGGSDDHGGLSTTGSIEITSPAFAHDSRIPDRHTGKGDDVSPALVWTGVPADARELVLVCDDPDAPMERPFVHWLVVGIAPEARGVAEGMLPPGAAAGENDFGGKGYRGPMPPPGRTHHYRFRLYALDAASGLRAGATHADAIEAISEHVMAEGELVGTFSTD